METYHHSNKISFNQNKTNIVFNSNNRKVLNYTVTFNNTQLNNSINTIVLGIITNNANNFNDHLAKGFQEKTKLTTVAVRKLNLLIKMKYWTSPTQLRVIANGILNGPINYGIQNWIHSKPNLIEQLEVIREKAARVILGITKVYKLGRTEVLKKVGWMTLYQFAEAQKYSHIHRTLITGKPLQLFRELTDNRTREQATAKQIYSKTRSK